MPKQSARARQAQAGLLKSGRTHLDAESLTYRLHTTVIELRLKWNGHHFVAVTNISFSTCPRGRR